MTNPLKSFADAAAATRLERAENRAKKAIEANNTHTAHLKTFIAELVRLPAVGEYVSFKGGMTGNKGSLSYASTYGRRNLSVPYLTINANDDNSEIMISYFEGKGLEEQAERLFPCNDQLQALDVVAWYLGTVAPEREAEIAPVIGRACLAIKKQNQMQSGHQGRWSARGSQGTWHDGPYGGSPSRFTK